MSVARMMQMAAAGVSTGGGGAVWTDPDLANASYDSVSFSVSAQAALPIDFYIKPDGTRFFVVDLTNDTIYQYSLSSAWDISSASYDSISFSLTGQSTDARGVSFKPDGTKMFILDAGTDDVYQYSLSTAWDISTASYDNVNLALSTLITIGSGLFFNSDGTKFFIPCRGSDYIYEYDVSTAYDIGTASYNSVRLNVVSVDNTPEGVYFSPTGDKMFFVGAGNDAVYQYSLSTAFDLSSAVYDSVSFSVASQDTVPAGLSFKDDGSKMYILGLGTDTIYQYSTAAAAPAEWTDPDLANASYDSVSFSVSGQDTSPSGFYIGDEGRKLYLSGGASDSIYQYTLTAPWDLSTASYDSVSFSVSSQDTQPNGIMFKSDGTIMYVSGNAGNDINQYSLSTAWDLSSASFDSKTLSINSQDPTPRGLAFNTDGSILLVVGGSNDTIFQYTLTTPWDISTGLYASKSFDTTSQETGPYGIYLSPNEDKLWLIGFSADAVLQYSLTAADISTASYDSISFSVSSQETSPYTVFFKDDGSKMYVMGPINGTIYQYSTA